MSNSYLENLLGDNEHILLESRQHWFIFVRSIFFESLVIAVILTGVTIAITTNQPYPWLKWGYFLLLIPVISFIYDYFQWRNRAYILTDFRVIQISGVINKNVIDSSLEKVNDVKLTQSFLGRIFNFGTVEIMTASELGINEITTLDDPIKFKTTMVNAKEALEYGMSGRRGPAVMNAPTDVPSMIAQLDNLRQQGLLTPEEFQAKKAELLKRL
jgi:membrane protein YdbS with pleckstrin-like domain